MIPKDTLYFALQVTKLPPAQKYWLRCLSFYCIALHFESSISVMHTQIEFQVTQTGLFFAPQALFLQSISFPLVLAYRHFRTPFAWISLSWFRWLYVIVGRDSCLPYVLSQINNIITLRSSLRCKISNGQHEMACSQLLSTVSFFLAQTDILLVLFCWFFHAISWIARKKWFFPFLWLHKKSHQLYFVMQKSRYPCEFWAFPTTIFFRVFGSFVVNAWIWKFV